MVIDVVIHVVVEYFVFIMQDEYLFVTITTFNVVILASGLRMDHQWKMPFKQLLVKMSIFTKVMFIEDKVMTNY